MIRTALALAAVAAASTTAAHAGWTRLADDKMTAVHPSSTAGAAPLLSCKGGKFSLLIAMDDSDFDVIKEDRSKRRRRLSGRIMVDGEEVYEGLFSYRPSVGVAQAFERQAASKVFNAAVRGQRVDFDLSGKGTVSLNVPNADGTFAAFADECRS